MNRKNENAISQFLEVVGKPARVSILLAIGEDEACVCHLEAVLGLRQAYISQHLMALRDANILATRREGRYIFYRLKDPQMLAILRLTGVLVGIPENEISLMSNSVADEKCCCPHCAPQDLVKE